MSQSYCLDAAEILGFGTPSTDPLPAPIPGQITLRIQNGLTLQVLRDCPVGRQMMLEQDWYDRYAWCKAPLPAGVYGLRIPVSSSNLKTAAEQIAMLPVGEKLAPVTLVAAALLCIHAQAGADPLTNDWTRCAEQTADGYHAELTWNKGRLSVYGFWDEYRLSNLWASSVRTSCPLPS